MRAIFIFIMMIFSSITFGQLNKPSKEKTDSTENLIIYFEDTDKSIQEHIYESFNCDENASFPGGETGLLKFITTNTQYPEQAIKKKVQGTVFLRFVITKMGGIAMINVLRSIDPLLDNEAIRVIESLPKWYPAKIKGTPVNCWYIVPIKFILQ